MKILIIGSEGFIGKFLVRKLIDAGYEVVGMDICSHKQEENSYNFLSGDVLNPKDILRAAKGVDAVINLAAKHHDFGISRDDFFKVNVCGTKNILDCASRLSIKRIVFYSTVAVYGTQNKFTTEDTTPDPESDYGKSKLAAEDILLQWAHREPYRQVVIIRPTVVFGPGNYANMYNLINSIYKKRFIFVGRGENIKSVAYVENLVAATIFLIQHPRLGAHIYNYSDYPQMTIGEIVEIITHHLYYSMPKFRLPLRPTLITAGIFDLMGKLTGYNFPITANRIKKFNTQTFHKSDRVRAIGFKPPVDLSEGFRKMVEWYLDNGNGKLERGKKELNEKKFLY